MVNPLIFNKGMMQNQVTFRISLHVNPVMKNSVQTPIYQAENHAMNHKSHSLVSMYDDEDYLVKNPNDIWQFGQQSSQNRILDLQTAAASTVIPDNRSTWYLRFNNLCLMTWIYLPPPNYM
jgi:hypothetical protein